MPQAASFSALNEQLLADCRRRFDDRLRGQSETIGERLARDLACCYDLPASPYEACKMRTVNTDIGSVFVPRWRSSDWRDIPTRG